MSIKSDTEFIVLQLVIERTCTRASGNVMYPLRNKSLQRSHVVKKINFLFLVHVSNQ